MIDATFYTNNRQTLAQKVGGKGLIVVAGNALMQRSSDTHFDFRQDSNLRYLCGIQEPSTILCIDIDAGEEYLIVPMRTGHKATFDGAIDITALTKVSGISTVYDERQGWQRIKTSRAKKVFFMTPPPPMYDTMATNPFRARVAKKLKSQFGTKLIDLRPFIIGMRQIKQPAEIAMIEQAATITYQALYAVLQQLDTHKTEASVEGELTALFRRAGASGHAYSPIIAAGAASCTLHYSQNSNILQTGKPLLFDVGAEFEGYAADISRTVIVGQKATTRQKDVINAVAEAQADIAQWLKPGVTWKELSAYADSSVTKGLVKLGLIKNITDKQGLRAYFPHAISHFLGLDVHDIGDYTEPLQPGMVITIEPGIYIAKEELGVRIEDDYVITKNGARRLGEALPAVL